LASWHRKPRRPPYRRRRGAVSGHLRERRARREIRDSATLLASGV